MEDIFKRGLLFDFYGALLNEHQQSVYKAFAYENLSLSEIASEYGVSRQGVHDLIKRCDKMLDEYEDKLHLVSKFNDIKADVELIENKSDSEEVRILARNIIERL